MRRFLTITIFILVFAVGAGFATLNITPVEVNYFFGSQELPLSIILIITLIIGTLLGVMALFARTLLLRYENTRLTKRLQVLEQEIDSLRILPIRDSP